MKMIVLFLFVFISGVFAGNANSQETKVSISKNNKPIREILGEIERQTDYLFVYSEKEVDVNQRKTVNVSQQRVADVLSSLFRSTNVGYAMEGHNIMLMAKTTQTDAAQQKRHITGVVKDIKGETIIGANIMSFFTQFFFYESACIIFFKAQLGIFVDLLADCINFRF